MAPQEMTADARRPRVLSIWMGLKMHEGLNVMACAVTAPPGLWLSSWDTGMWFGQVWDTQVAIEATGWMDDDND